MTAMNVLSLVGLLTALLSIALILAPRRGQARRTLPQHIIRGLYRSAAWLEDLAIGMDRGYLAYRCERSLNEIEPENERIGQPGVCVWHATTSAAEGGTHQ